MGTRPPHWGGAPPDGSSARAAATGDAVAGPPAATLTSVAISARGFPSTLSAIVGHTRGSSRPASAALQVSWTEALRTDAGRDSDAPSSSAAQAQAHERWAARTIRRQLGSELFTGRMECASFRVQGPPGTVYHGTCSCSAPWWRVGVATLRHTSYAKAEAVLGRSDGRFAPFSHH